MPRRLGGAPRNPQGHRRQGQPPGERKTVSWLHDCNPCSQVKSPSSKNSQPCSVPTWQLGQGTGPGRACGEQLRSSWDGAAGTRRSPRPRTHCRPQTGAELWAPHFSTLHPSRRQHLLPSPGAQRGQVLSPLDPAGKLPNHPAQPGPSESPTEPGSPSRRIVPGPQGTGC